MARALASEDKSLTTSLLTSRAKKYKDIDLTFAIKGNKDIYKKEDVSAVQQAMKTLLLTNRFERPFMPNFGSNIRAQLFEMLDTSVAQKVREDIIFAIQKYEPRAIIKELGVTPLYNTNELRVSMVYQIKNSRETVQFTGVIQSLR